MWAENGREIGTLAPLCGFSDGVTVEFVWSIPLFDRLLPKWWLRPGLCFELTLSEFRMQGHELQRYDCYRITYFRRCCAWCTWVSHGKVSGKYCILTNL